MAISKMRNPMDDMENEQLPVRPKSGNKIGKMIATVIILLILIAAICAAIWGCSKLLNGDPLANVSGKDWQAIFLSNGQVYFGKVNAVGNKTLTLSDIYYLQVVTKPLQQTQTGEASAANSTQQELTLIKLGNEIHGPSDRMIINLDQVLLTEKLKTDSRVVQAISKYVADQKKK